MLYHSTKHDIIEKSEAKMRTIRWGIIGCGNVTEVKSGPGFQKAANSALVAVMRRNAALAEDYARRHGVPRWYADAQALIADPDVDAVYVATPPASHMEYALACARAGKPVYVEKPMARTLAECEAMIDACRSAGVPLFVAYYRRTLPRFLKIKELIESGAIGDVRLVTVTLHQKPAPDDADPAKRPWRVVPEIAGGGKFLDLASHTLDFLDYLLGPIVQVKGLAAQPGRPLSRRRHRDRDVGVCVGRAGDGSLVFHGPRRPGRDRDRRQPGQTRLLHLRRRADQPHDSRWRIALRHRESRPHPAADDPDGRG